MLDVDGLVRAACEKAELSDFGDNSYREGLSVLVEAVNNEPKLSAEGEQRLQEFIINNLANRLRVEGFIQTNPGVVEQPIEKPLFLFGLPRSGTTLAINLLHEDPARRCLLRWEAYDSIPPPTTATLKTDPRCIREQMIVNASVLHAPHISAIHHENADSPTECQFIMTQTGCAQYYEAIAEIPSYRKWWLAADYLSTFSYHKRLLQVLQWHAPGRWTLKNPWHALYLDSITTVYPDAQLVMTHRDPIRVIASFCSLIKHVRAMFSRDIDTKSIGADIVDTFEEMTRRTLDFRERNGWSSIYDLHYSDLMAAPMNEISKIYQHFDEPLTAAAEKAMHRYIHNNPKGKHGRHDYSLDEYGLAEKEIENRFADYYDRFNVQKDA